MWGRHKKGNLHVVWKKIRVWRNCKVRLFTVCSHCDKTKIEESIRVLLHNLRIVVIEVQAVQLNEASILPYTRKWSIREKEYQEHQEFLQRVGSKEVFPTEVSELPGISPSSSDDDMKEKSRADDCSSLNAKILHHSSNSALVLINLPDPRVKKKKEFPDFFFFDVVYVNSSILFHPNRHSLFFNYI